MTPGLVVRGHVQRALRLSFAALDRLALSLPSQPVRLVAGRDVPALRLDALLARVGVKASARSLLAESDDGRSLLKLPLSATKTGLLVYRVGEQPLPRGLGGPLRLIVPRYGEIKALGTLYLTDTVFASSRDDDVTQRFTQRFTDTAWR